MINFNDRLKKLKDRRQGTTERYRLEKGFADYDVDLRINEAYENLRENVAIKYVIGAMAPVNHESTQVSIDEGERIASTLIDMLNTCGVSTIKRMQGSVALDIHIKGHSDVDMLIIKDGVVSVQTPKIDGTKCYSSDPRPMKDMVKEIRDESEEKLTSRYHAATVDCSGSKSIALSGGSLRRKVDIVPSCWYNTHDYQRSKQEHDRSVEVYDKNNHELIANKPFLHIKRVNDKDAVYNGNLKKVARLMKNIVADMPDYKKTTVKKLSSYDLTGIAYSMDDRLNSNEYLPLTLVENLRFYLSMLKSSALLRNMIEVPDGTRKVFDKDDKLEALEILTKEVEDLAFAIQKQISPINESYDSQILTNQIVFM